MDQEKQKNQEIEGEWADRGSVPHASSSQGIAQAHRPVNVRMLAAHHYHLSRAIARPSVAAVRVIH